MENKTTYNGFGLDIILTIVFVILKLVGVIDWKWIWVLAPLWIGVGLAIIIFIIIAIVAAAIN